MDAKYNLPSLNLIVLFLNLILVYTTSANAGSIATYWGQNHEEGKLAKACATGNYDYINIAYLTTFGSGRTPVLNISCHSNAALRGCSCGLGREIKACQRLGVKVLLSLGGETGQQSLNSTDDAVQVAKYLYHNFLGGKSTSRPFGSAILDGIDFSIAGKTRKDRMHWEDLAKAIANFSSAERKVYLTAAPHCAFPDKTLRKALSTSLFDIVWIRFYNHPSCRYSAEDLMPLKLSWERWNAKVQASQVFIGLPASGEASESGYVPPGNFTGEVLPFISNFPKYGGVMLWDRYCDTKNKYSDQIKCDIKPCNATSSIYLSSG